MVYCILTDTRVPVNTTFDEAFYQDVSIRRSKEVRGRAASPGDESTP